MIKLDNRVGSGDLSSYFQQWKVPYTLCRLEYGDCAFTGHGPNGPCEIAVEIKKIKDALNCITTGRFAGRQLKGLICYKAVWLIVEGPMLANWRTGMLMTFKGKKLVPIVTGSNRQWMYRDIDHWLTTMEVKAGLHVRRTMSRTETARLIADLYQWWTEKEYDEHRAHLQFDQGQIDGAIREQPGLVKRVAASLPAIGWVRSTAVARKFQPSPDVSPREAIVNMMLASEEEWKEIEGIGEGVARTVDRGLAGKFEGRSRIVAAPKGRV